MSHEYFRIRNYDDYERALCMMGYASDNSDVSNISSDRTVTWMSGSSRNGDSGKFCSYSCDFSKHYM